MKIFSGTTSKISGNEIKNVFVNGNKLTSNHYYEHGCSFNWGYHGHAPRYLAEALMLNLGFSSEFAIKNMTKVSQEFICTLPNNWQFTEQELISKVESITMH